MFDTPAVPMPADPAVAPPAPVAPSGARQSRRHVWLRRLAWTFAVLLLLFLLAWQALPRLARWQGEERLTRLLGRQVTIGNIEFRPWSLELTISDVAIAGQGGGEPLLKVARLYANAAIASVWRLAPVLQSVEVDAPVVRLTRLGEGRYDIDDLIAKFSPDPKTPPPPPSEPARFSLNNLQLHGGVLRFDDKPVGAQHRLEQLELALPFISNLPKDVEVLVKPRLAFTLNGAAFDSDAQSTPFAQDRETKLKLRIGDAAHGDLDLAPYLGYLPKTLPVKLARGRVGADLDIAFELQPDGKTRLALSGGVRAADVQVDEPSGAPLGGFSRLAVPLVDVQPLAKRVHLGAVTLDGVSMRVARDAAGVLSLQRLFGAGASTTASASALSASASAASASTSPPASASSASAAESGPAASAVAAVGAASADAASAPGAASAPVTAISDPAASGAASAPSAANEASAPLPAEAPSAPTRTAGAASVPAPARTASSAGTPAASPSDWHLELDSLALNGAAVDWNDASVTPAAALRLGEIALSAKAVRWPQPAPVPVELHATLRPQGDGAAAAGTLSLSGSANDRAAKLALQIESFELPVLAPYLSPFLVPRVEGRLDTKATLDWAAGEEARTKLGVESLRLADLKLAGVAPASAASPPAVAASSASRATAAKRPIAKAPKVERAAAAAGIATEAGEAFSLKELALGDVEVDLPAKRAVIGSLHLQQPWLQLARDRQGRWNALDWLPASPPEAASAPARPVAAKPGAQKRRGAAPSEAAEAAGARTPSGWRAELRDFKLEGGRVGLVDERPRAAATPAESVRLLLANLQLGAQGLAYSDGATGEKAPAPAKVQFAAQLTRGVDVTERRNGARFEWRGTLGLQPLDVKGNATIERFPVHAFVPYVDNPLRLTLQRARAGYRGEVAFRQTPRGPDVSAAGEVQLNDLSVLAKPDPPVAGAPDELLNWQTFVLRDIKFGMAPAGRPRVDIGRAELSDFYARLLVTEQGRLNLQDVTGAPVTTSPSTAPASIDDAASAPPAAASAPPAAASAPPAPAGSASAPAGPGLDLPLDLNVGGVALNRGRVDFSDHFVRPNYSAQLTELTGTMGAFRSDQPTLLAPLELRGRAAGTALLEIVGQVNPTAHPLALDIRAKATDLELAPLSPYAAKYAGYDIDRGKLSMDVSYDIRPDGTLNAKNQVILNQLVFGKKVESPTATKLPVLLAVALLKDRNGVIDINLPISGSLNDPQFSVGGLIVKVLFNLLVKALTSPFALLTGGFGGGGGDQQSVIEFRPGTAKFVDADGAIIDKVAKALQDRPALTMTVTGSSDLGAEGAAYQNAQLDDRIVAARRRELTQGGAAPDAPVKLSAEDHDRLVKEIYSQTKLPDKPRNLIGIAKDIPVPDMEAMLRATVRPNTDAMRELALQRGVAVRDALIAKGLSSERLFLAAPQVREGDKADAGGKPWTPSVELSLSTK